MYGNLASVYGLSGIPNMIIDRLEIVKGPSSTLYGSEAVAGVINIITKNFEDQPYFSLDVQGTSHSESYINLAMAPKVGKSKTYLDRPGIKKIIIRISMMMVLEMTSILIDFHYLINGIFLESPKRNLLSILDIISKIEEMELKILC